MIELLFGDLNTFTKQGGTRRKKQHKRKAEEPRYSNEGIVGLWTFIFTARRGRGYNQLPSYNAILVGTGVSDIEYQL